MDKEIAAEIIPLTEEELADIAAANARHEADALRVEEARQSALEKLAKLGLTEDEAKAVIGIQ